MPNLIELFSSIEECRIESSLPYLWWGGVSVVAAACGRSVWTRLMGASGPCLHSNLYIVLVGDSNQGKSLAVRSAAERFLSMKLHISADALPGDGTKFINWARLANARRIQSGRDAGLVVALESLDSIFSKKADGQLKSFLCAAYDCKDPWTLDIGIQGKEPIRQLCLNLLAAANPGQLATCFKPEDWNEGLISRFLFVAGGALRLDELPVLNEARVAEYEAGLVALRDSVRGGVEIGWTPEVLAARRAWRRNQLRLAPPHPSAAGYWSWKYPTAAKLSMLLAVAAGESTIATSHWDAALAALSALEVGLPGILTYTGGNPYAGVIAQVLRWMEGEARDVREPEVLRRLASGIPPQHLQQTIESLVNSQQILEVPGAGSSPNRRFLHPALTERKVLPWKSKSSASA